MLKWLARRLILLALWFDSDLDKSLPGSSDHGYAKETHLDEFLRIRSCHKTECLQPDRSDRAMRLIEQALSLDPTLRQPIHLADGERHWVIALDELDAKGQAREREQLRHEAPKPLGDGLEP